MSYPNIINEINKVNISKVTYSDALFLGDVRFNTDSSQIALKSTKDNIQFNINGGTAYNRGAWIALEGCDNTSGNFPAGSFNIRATNSSGNYCDFRGTAEGSLSWNNSDIITSSGGTMKGILSIPSNGIRGNNISGAIHIYSGTDYSNGALLRLCGNNDPTNPGEFSLWAGGNGSGCVILRGSTDKSLLWDNKRVVCIESSSGGATFYRKYSDGWIEQGGSATSEITGNTSITFPIAFSNTNYYLSGVGYVIAGVSRQSIGSKTTTGFSTGSEVKSWSSYFWYACGY